MESPSTSSRALLPQTIPDCHNMRTSLYRNQLKNDNIDKVDPSKQEPLPGRILQANVLPTHRTLGASLTPTNKSQ